MGTPFLDKAREIHESKTLYAMARDSHRARSHTWWRRLFEYGPWGGTEMVCPPDPVAIKGIADLFGMTPDQVSRMVAEDWFGVTCDPRVSKIKAHIGALDDTDFELLVDTASHLAQRGPQD